MSNYYFFLFVAGLSGAYTYVDLSHEKVASQSHTEAFDANNAVDRDPKTCMRTLPIGQSSPHKIVWWKVDLGEIYNIYSIHILFKNYDGYESRQQGRFAGFSLYISNTDVSNTGDREGLILCYKDESPLPPLNFTTLCKEHGRYVIFYNERLDGINYPKNYTLTTVYTELCEVIVKGCDTPNVYGIECNIPCPTNCKDKTCNIENGNCFGCTPGWIGVTCTTKCREGWYGVNCTQQCRGHCQYDRICNHVTGICDNGCKAGWTGHECDRECDDGKYGYDCVNTCSRNCLDGVICDKEAGTCFSGCNPGYMYDNCSKECTVGFFGDKCKNSCSRYCFNNETCDHVSGVCPRGCMDGYIGARCDNSCRMGYYGRNCSMVCSLNCMTCRNTDGYCTCIAGWSGFNCNAECKGSFGKNCQYQCNGFCVNKTCDRFNGSCLHGCENGEQCDRDINANDVSTFTSPDGIPSIIGWTAGAIVFIIIGMVSFMFVIRLKRRRTTISKRESIILEAKYSFGRNLKTDDLTSPYCRSQNGRANNAIESTYALPERTKRGPPTNKNIPVKNISAQIANMSARENAGFKMEYHDIPRGELHPCEEAKKPENKAKNRYTTIFPYDHSRIILTPLTSDGRGGYINANYIEDTRGSRFYIATQGPKPKTIEEFWTMIWQEEVCNIVCLTNLTEGTKNKCAQYWPDINDKLQGGTLTIRHLEEKTYAEYIIRRFKIHNKTARSDRYVTLFHYTTWSDHGVADPLSLVVFHRHVIRATANSAGKFTVVHCSAGVGRTGTYIALDALYREGERTGKINVPMYVRTMRKDRINMIQGDDQYKLLYLALKDAFYGQNKCLGTEKFLGEYQEQTCYTNCGDVLQKKSLSSDLEELLSLRKEYTQEDYISGRAHISANYTESVLPVEEFMCHLYYMKGYNTYYNAVLIQSFLEKDSLISAQYPLPDNTEDFLRLVKDFDARVVVFLCPLEGIGSTSKWFPPENQHKFNGIFYVKNKSSTRSPNVKMARLNIQPTGFNEMDITLLECPTWGERQKSGDKRVLLDVVKAVKTEKSDQKGRVLVLSRDGATRCGPFFVVYNVLEQIAVDREVDIFTAVRQIQIRRPECVSTVDEYKLCHDAVAEYLLNDCVYGNC